MVPIISTSSGIILLRTPPVILPILITAASLVNSVCRLTMVCKPRIICADTVTGSTPVQGVEPCVCLPLTLMTKRFTAAKAPPGLKRTSPTGVFELM